MGQADARRLAGQARRRRAFTARMSPRRFAALLTLLFLALAVPAASLVWLGFRQLELETFRQQQIIAEGIVASIDRRLSAAIAAEEARPSADYSFAIEDADGAVKTLQISPLAEFPSRPNLPGAIGHFQVDASGTLTTPLLPDSVDPANVDLVDIAALAARQAVADSLLAVLADNRLINRPVAASARLAPSDAAQASVQAAADSEQRSDALRQQAAAPQSREAPATAGQRQFGASSAASENAAADSVLIEAASNDAVEEQVRDAPSEIRGQAGFDRLATRAQIGPVASPRRALESAALAEAEADAGDDAPSAIEADTAPASAAATSSPGQTPREIPETPFAAKVSAFSSELEPMNFSRLNTGHFVLFRSARRDGERLVQGLLIDNEEFLLGGVYAAIDASGLARGVSVAIDTGDGDRFSATTDSQSASIRTRSLLRARLSPPLAEIALEFAAGDLPPSPVRAVLIWSAVVLFSVLVGGIFAMYRFGAQQLRLAHQQRNFVSAVSHELKTPLTAIRMYAEMLRSDWATEEKKQNYYDFIFTESERLSRLIENVLTLASIDRGSNSVVLDQMTVAEVVDLARSKLSGIVQQSSFELSTEIDDTIATASVRIDADAIVQVFINLVDNALKFAAAAERREIVFSAGEGSDGRVIFRVRDFGPGITEPDMRRLFELFYRPDNELTRTTSGTGIGLALVKQMAAQMGAQVDARNADPGATFSISFSPIST
jgi:two-component system phosphate regulon sensor histidine kinase PhoR